MSNTSDSHAGMQKGFEPPKKTVLGMGLLFFVILAVVALTICNFRAQYATQAILNQQRDVQQTWLDKSLDAIRNWRNELVAQARFISSSEMFRLFVIDARSFPEADIAKLPDPDTLQSEDEALRSMAEQYTYVQDLLRDFTRRRAWTDARILLPDGKIMVEPQFSLPLTAEQTKLAVASVDKGHAMFGSLRKTENGIVIDMADPLFEVLGSAEPKVVAVLLLSVPMDKTLATFLARNGEQTETLLPRIVNNDD